MRLKLAAVFTCLALSPARAWDPNKPFIYEMKIAFETDNWVNAYSTSTVLSKSDNTVAFQVVANSTTSPAYQLVVTTQGNVGISTGNPTQKLEVAGTVYSTSGGFKFPDNTTQTSAGIASPSSAQTGDLLYYDGSAWNRLAAGAAGQSLKMAYDGYTKLLIHADGTNGSTAFTDSAAGKAVTAGDNAKIDTSQSEFGGSSARFDGSGDYLSVPDSDDWDFPGDFTVDFWVRFNSFPSGGNGKLCGNSNDGASVTGWYLVKSNASSSMSFYISDTPGSFAAFGLSGTCTLSLGTWYHIALVRYGSAVTLYLNGQSIGSGTYSGSITSTNPLHIGGCPYYGRYIDGWIDEFRVSKGIARWTSNFTPPAAAFAPSLNWSN